MRRFALLLLAAFLLSGCAIVTKQELKPAAKTLTHGRLVYLGTEFAGGPIAGSRGTS